MYSGIAELLNIEECLKNYNHYLAKRIFNRIKGLNNVLEFGAGIGTLAKNLSNLYKIKPECIELDPRLAEVIHKNEFVCYRNLNQTTKVYDAIYSSNVLEHIEDDSRALKEIASRIKIGGYLILYLPAKKILYSEIDRDLGHYRRYEAQELNEKVRTAGFEILEWEYNDALGLLIWLFYKVKKYRNISPLKNNRALNIYDKYLFPVSSALDRLGFKKIIGKNIFLVAQRIS